MKFIAGTIIIGGGPIGLYLANHLERNKKKYLLLEATDQFGGQISNLYPNKLIEDLPDFPNIIAKDYIEKLLLNLNSKNLIKNQKVISIKEENDYVVIQTSTTQYLGKYAIIATGLGFYTPRKLNLENEEKCKNIIYSLKDISFLKNKKIAIFGGGDSALDWAKNISKISSDVSLIHRRDEFRGNAKTICGCDSLRIYKPYIPYKLNTSSNKANSIIIQNVNDQKELITIPVDYIVVNFGLIPSNQHFGFESDGLGLITLDNKLTSKIFVIGDAASYPNKKRRLAPGNKEADNVFKYIN